MVAEIVRLYPQDEVNKKLSIFTNMVYLDHMIYLGSENHQPWSGGSACVIPRP